MEVMKKLEGAYALLIKSRHYPGEMVAAKRGSPMIVGIKEGQAKKSGGGLTHRCACTHMRLTCATQSVSHMHHTCPVDKQAQENVLLASMTCSCMRMHDRSHTFVT
jgi:glucosamine 6-phosphate synthetase-like amidotransferase/phosphosugar isomerase protein